MAGLVRQGAFESPAGLVRRTPLLQDAQEDGSAFIESVRSAVGIGIIGAGPAVGHHCFAGVGPPLHSAGADVAAQHRAPANRRLRPLLVRAATILRSGTR